MHDDANTTAQIKVCELAGETLDYWVYRCAALHTDRTYSVTEFESGYGQGQFRFCRDAKLLNDLVETYQIRLQRLSDEWLASSTHHSQYGPTALVASCRWLVCYTFGAKFEPNSA